MNSSAPSPSPRAASLACAYHLRPGIVPCGEPATHRNFTGVKWMLLCEAHAIQVQKATQGKCKPTPLVETVIAEKRDSFDLPVTLDPVGPVPSPGVPAVPIARAASTQLEQLRRFRETLAGRPDSGSL